MNLVFNDFITYLKDNNCPVDLEEGYYWFDYGIIKCYDKKGNIHKIVKIIIDDSLELNFKLYPKQKIELESWNETITRKEERLKKLEKESLELIKKSLEKYKRFKPVILNSRGKDSCVVDYLVSKIVDSPSRFFNNTTLDVSDTYKFIKQFDNLTIINPDEGFYTWREKENIVPTRVARSCCRIFKEGAMVEKIDSKEKLLFFLGMRNSESRGRSGYGDEWRNPKWDIRKWQGILPIRKWSEEDVWLYILKENIAINPKYYKGYNRCGCGIACPYSTKPTWALDKYWYPKMYERWHNILEKDFIENKKAPILNCSLKEYHICWNGTRIREVAPIEVIEEFAKTQNLDLEIAKKYFDKKCMNCNKNLKALDIGLSLKYYGRNIEDFKCIKCISKDLNTTQKELKEKAKYFKNSNCDLF
ncbi:MAG: phosphoadenosine phosphosulfate reductase family protein [Clostridia bacterium]|nr:phosphoadenosine phosphosulfate reductase family protein [Clostridia bacterium]